VSLPSCKIVETSSETEVLEICIQREAELVILDTAPEMDAVQDDLIQYLEKIGIDLKVTVLDREAYIAKERNGEFNILFTRTWGAPCDPHSYLESWEAPSHVEYSILGGLEAPLTRDDLLLKVEHVQGT
jgi:nickel transport system substrate-binding protein